MATWPAFFIMDVDGDEGDDGAVVVVCTLFFAPPNNKPAEEEQLSRDIRYSLYAHFIFYLY